ncbi:hypothetical protein Q8G48_28680, partial [Klebsiella pneumoniae]
MAKHLLEAAQAQAGPQQQDDDHGAYGVTHEGREKDPINDQLNKGVSHSRFLCCTRSSRVAGP